MNFFFGKQPIVACKKCGSIFFTVFFPKDVTLKRSVVLKCVLCENMVDLEDIKHVDEICREVNL